MLGREVHMGGCGLPGTLTGRMEEWERPQEPASPY